MTDHENSLSVRVVRVEEDLRELRTDIRSLTGAVANLASTVAVLSERLSKRADMGPPAAAPSLAMVGGALGSAAMLALAKYLGLA